MRIFCIKLEINQGQGINVFLNTLQFIHDNTMPTPYRRALPRPYGHDKAGKVRFNVTLTL